MNTDIINRQYQNTITITLFNLKKERELKYKEALELQERYKNTIKIYSQKIENACWIISKIYYQKIVKEMKKDLDKVKILIKRFDSNMTELDIRIQRLDGMLDNK